jgi:hypothetical protein
MFLTTVNRMSWWWTEKVWGRFWGWSGNLLDAVFCPQPPEDIGR